MQIRSIHGANTLSLKVLLKANADNVVNPQSHCPSQSVVGNEVEAVPVLPTKAEDRKEEIVVVRLPAEKSSKVVPLPLAETEVVEQEKMNHVYNESKIVVHTKEYEQKDDNTYKDEGDEIGRRVSPGSPSFKIYCTEPQKMEEEESK